MSGAPSAGQPVAFDPGGALRYKAARDAARAADVNDLDAEEDLDAIF